MNKRIKAVIFDMDGVITDTEKLLVKYWCKAANEFGYKMEPKHAIEIRSLAGKYCEPLLKTYFGESFDYKKVRARRIELMNADIAAHGLEKKTGIDELLDYLGKNGYKRAVATATDITRATNYLTMLGVYDKFDRIICASMVENGKPKPDIYIYAASELGYNTNECIAVEDSPNGVTSASDAGCMTIMVPDLTQPDEELKKRIYCKCDKLTDIINVVEKIRLGEADENFTSQQA